MFRGRDSCLTPSFSTYQASIYNNVSLIYGIASKTVNVSTGHHTRSVLKIRLNGYPFVVIGTSTLVQDPSLLKVTNEGTFEGTSELKVTKVRRYEGTNISVA